MLDDLDKKFSGFDSLDILAAIGGLQLLPANARKVLRLEAVAHAILDAPTSRGPQIGLSRLESVVNGPLVAKHPITLQEDPPSSSFTEELTFHGPVRWLPGISTNIGFMIRHLLPAMFGDREEGFSDLPVVAYCGCVSLAILEISNELCRRAGLVRWTPPGNPLRGLVTFPPNPQKFSQLKEWVTFSEAEIRALLERRNTSTDWISRLVTDVGEPSRQQYSLTNGRLFVTPIVRDGSRFVVPVPGLLVPALRSLLVGMAVEHGIEAAFAERYNRKIFNSMDWWFVRMGWARVNVGARLSEMPFLGREAFYAFDEDKIAYCALFTDDFRGYNPLEPDGPFESGLSNEFVKNRISEVEREIYSNTEIRANHLFFLIVHQGVGRHADFSYEDLTDDTRTVLFISAAELEVVADLEEDEPLALWKFAVDSTALRQTAMVLSFDLLDEYSQYRHLKHSFYFSDDERPNAVSFDTSGVGELKSEIDRKHDHHGVIGVEAGQVTPVARVYEGRDIPIYTPPIQRREAVAYETTAGPIWVTPPDGFPPSVSNEYRQIAETICYWLWQFEPTLKQDYLRLIAPLELVRIRVILERPGDWERVATSDIEVKAPYFERYISAEYSSNEVLLNIRPEIEKFFQVQTNEGERLLMSFVLSSLRELGRINGVDCLSVGLVEQAIAQHAGNPQKKMISNFSTGNNIALDNRGLPPFRPIQDADMSRMMDQLGEDLIARKSYPIGEIETEKRSGFLQDAVGLLYERLRSLISTLDYRSALDWLIAHSESAVSHSEQHKLTITTRLACFLSEGELIENLLKEAPKINHSAISCRFLIELVASNPPEGIRRMSWSLYDELLALASLIVGKGQEKDLIELGLSDMGLAVLPSRRLGTSRDSREAARQRFLADLFGSEIPKANEYYIHRWEGIDPAPGRTAFVARLNAASEHEFGATFEEILQFLHEIALFGLTIDRATPRCPKIRLLNYLAATLKWPAERVEAIFERFLFEPRQDYLKPPKPYTARDVYPWRFNRRLSYLQKPLILCRSASGDEVAWGPRNLYLAARVLFELIHYARLQATSDRMKNFISELRNEAGDSFNTEVATELRTVSGLIVHDRIQKFGRLRGPSGPPGDFDVLAIDTIERKLIPIECKDFTQSRTPHELASELERFFDSAHEKSAVDKHTARVNWLRSNLEEVTKFFKIDDGAHWGVCPLIVTSQPLLSQYTGNSPIAIVTLKELVAQFRARS